MTITIKTPLLNSVEISPGLYTLSLSKQQAEDLIELLILTKPTKPRTMKELREEFFETQGYMETATVILKTLEDL